MTFSTSIVKTILGLCAFISLVTSGFTLAQANEVWLLPIPNEERPPISYNIDQNPTGILVDIAAETGRRIGVTIKAVPYPVAKRRAAFLDGTFVVECCPIPLWRNKPEEIANQVFSNPVHATQDIFLFPTKGGFPIPNPMALKDKQVAVIKGYSYKGEQFFGQRLDSSNALELLKLLDAGAADVGILQRRVAAYHIRQHNLHVEFGPLQHEVQGRFRIHKSKKAYLPAINEALAAMRQDGTIERIQQRHAGWMRYDTQANNQQHLKDQLPPEAQVLTK